MHMLYKIVRVLCCIDRAMIAHHKKEDNFYHAENFHEHCNREEKYTATWDDGLTAGTADASPPESAGRTPRYPGTHHRREGFQISIRDRQKCGVT